MGNTQQGGGYKYRGRGILQLTGGSNYTKAAAKFGVDLNDNPDGALDFDLAAKIMIWGMEKGIFTGKKLNDYNLVGMKEFFKHVSMQRVMKATLGSKAGAYVVPTRYPVDVLKPARGSFQMEYIHIANQFGTGFAPYSDTSQVEQNRMQVQMHEIAHLRNTAWAHDHKIAIAGATAVTDPYSFNGTTAYGALGARILAENNPNQALANAENIAFFIESAKHEP